jgi:hypothetical protein
MAAPCTSSLFTGTKRIDGRTAASQIASASFVGLRGCTAATVLLTVILLALNEGFDVGGRDKPHIMAQLTDLASPEMGAAAGLHRNHAPRQLAEKIQNLCPPQLLPQNRSACAVGSMQLEYILLQIGSDRDNLRHDRSPLWIVADPPWHIDAAGGRLHHQSLRRV